MFNDLLSPQVLVCETNFILVYKPPKMHSVSGKGKSLVEWCVEKYPELENLSKGEAGLIHRLDFETHGLVLFARNEQAFDMLLEEQKSGEIIKEYGALVSGAREKKDGFPVFERDIGYFQNSASLENSSNLDTDASHDIKSMFRPYGPGRKEVRPVDYTALRLSAAKKKAGSKIYTTEILEIRPASVGDIKCIRVSIQQGFRHQIRCHLAWAGYPVINDPVYGGKSYSGVFSNEENPAQGILALRAKGISFMNPGSGEKLCYALPDIDLKDV
jgi:23S rRNA pseudouridine1911/1915/1917 synthase